MGFTIDIRQMTADSLYNDIRTMITNHKYDIIQSFLTMLLLQYSLKRIRLIVVPGHGGIFVLVSVLFCHCSSVLEFCCIRKAKCCSVGLLECRPALFSIVSCRILSHLKHLSVVGLL